MKAIEFSPKVYKKLQLLRKKDPKLYQKIIEQLDLFEKNPKHRSLRLHKIKYGDAKIWSISLSKGYRMLYQEDETIYFVNIGTHNEIYKK